MRDERDDVLIEAISKVGGQSALARKLGISPAAVNQWTRVPLERVWVIAELTGIDAHKLRDDVIPRPKSDEASAPAVAQ